MRASLLLLVLAASPALAAEATFPSAFEATRYEQMMQDSPFALATAVAPPSEPKERFTANWKVTVLAKFPDEEGAMREWVVVRSQDQRLAFTLRGKEPVKEGEAAGVALDRVEWNEAEPRKSRVFLKKDNDVEPVEIAQDTAPAAAPPNPGALPGQRPGVQLPGQAGVIRQPPPGTATPPRPGVLPGQPQTQPPGMAPRPQLPRPGQPVNGFPPVSNQVNRPGPVPAPGIQQSGPARKPRVIPAPTQ